MLDAKKAYAMANNYTDESLVGGGAIQGKPCKIESITDITGGHRVEFSWSLDDGTTKTAKMDVMDGEQGEQGEQGEKGDEGFSPEITIKTATSDVFILHIKTSDDEFDTPNLKGSGAGTNVTVDGENVIFSY